MSDAVGTSAMKGGISVCGSCDAENSVEARFCSGCGAQMGTGSASSSAAEADNTLSLTSAWGIYAGAIGLMALTIGFFANFSFLVYIAIGVYMSRGVMRRLIEWHPMYDTLYNVTSAKLWMVGLWPLQMLMLLFRLTVNRAL